MSNLALGNKDDYPAAAAKHLDDASALLGAKRFDGAGYLAGYVIECSLRSVVMVGHMLKLAHEEANEKRRKSAPMPVKSQPKPGSLDFRFKRVASGMAKDQGRDHDLAELAKATTGYKDVLTSEIADYATALEMSKLPFGDKKRFTDIRYRAEGDLSADDARAWVEEAKAIYNATIGTMIRDGLVLR
ncbi:hypothetical protein WME91_19980 [Sorangium sp. So ce269]